MAHLLFDVCCPSGSHCCGSTALLADIKQGRAVPSQSLVQVPSLRAIATTLAARGPRYAIMGDHDFQPTCLSSEIHDAEIRDYVLHYTGCIEECERKDFYTLKNTVWQDEIRHEYARLRDQGVEEEMAQVQAAKDIGDKMERWKRICDEEMRRVEFLRAILGRDPDEQKLVQNVVNSRLEWKAMPGHDERKRKIRDWRANIRPLVRHNMQCHYARLEPCLTNYCADGPSADEVSEATPSDA